MERTKFNIQDAQYRTPYHHVVSFTRDDPRQYSELSWGLEYYGYASRVLELSARMPLRRVAEVGCGDGKILYELAQQVPEAQCEGFDLSEGAIAFAQAYAHGIGNLEFYAKDFSAAEGRYDLILCIETLEHIPDEEVDSFISVLKQKLVPGGSLIISVPTLNRPVQDKHYRHYDLTLLLSCTEKFVSLVSYEFIHAYRATGCRIITAMLANPLFILRIRRLRKILFAWYIQAYRIARAKTGTHLVAVFRNT